MSATKIATRYAKSLVDLAVEQGKLDRVKEDVQAFAKATEQRDFELLMKSPIVKADKKLSILTAIFGDKFDELTMAFMRILTQKGRESLLPEVAKEFNALFKIKNQISSVKITTAKKLSDAALEGIKAKLNDSSDTYKNLEIETVVDPDLIGGFVIEFDDKLYDSSVKHQLANLRKEFKDNLYKSMIVAD